MVEAASAREYEVFSASFSGAQDDLGQWRGYADESFGCAVNTTEEGAHKVADLAGWTIYDPTQRRIFAESFLNRLSASGAGFSASAYLTAAAAFMKHEGFASEREYRLLFFRGDRDLIMRSSGRRIVPSVEGLSGGKTLPLRLVRLGPGWQLSGSDELNSHPVVLGLKTLLEDRGLVEAGIEPSVIPYDPA